MFYFLNQIKNGRDQDKYRYTDILKEGMSKKHQWSYLQTQSCPKRKLSSLACLAFEPSAAVKHRRGHFARLFLIHVNVKSAERLCCMGLFFTCWPR